MLLMSSDPVTKGCLFICLLVTLVIMPKWFKISECFFAPYVRVIFLVFFVPNFVVVSLGLSWNECVQRDVPLSNAEI